MQLLFVFTIWRPEQSLNGVSSCTSAHYKCICPNFKMYLLKFSNIFAKLLQLLFLLTISLGLSLSPLRGVSSRPSADWAPGVTFSNAPQISRFPRARISSNSRTGFTEYLQFICLWSGDPDGSLKLSHALMDLMSKKCEWINLSNMYSLHHHIIVIVTFYYISRYWGKLRNKKHFQHSFWLGNNTITITTIYIYDQGAFES